MASFPEGVPGPLGRPSRDPRPQPPWAPGHLILFPARRPAHSHIPNGLVDEGRRQVARGACQASFKLFAGLGLGRREPLFLLAHANLQNAWFFVEDVWKTRGRRRHLPAFSLEDANQLNRMNNIFLFVRQVHVFQAKAREVSTSSKCLPDVFQENMGVFQRLFKPMP